MVGRILSLGRDDSLDEFKVCGPIGSGKIGLSTIYSTYGNGALKLYKGNTGDKIRYNEFKREPTLLSSLNLSDYVVDILCDFRETGIYNGKETVVAPYFVMELMHGNLESLIAIESLNLVDKIDIVKQIINGLIDMHNLDIYHRDLYTPNILYKKEEGCIRCKISDLGSAKTTSSSCELEYFIPTGCLAYTSPEAIVGLLGGDDVDKNIAVASDIFSLGILMYEVFSEERQNSLMSALAAIEPLADSYGIYNNSTKHDDRIAFLKNTVWPMMSGVIFAHIVDTAIIEDEQIAVELDSLIIKMLEINYINRISNLKEVLESLDSIKNSIGVSI